MKHKLFISYLEEVNHFDDDKNENKIKREINEMIKSFVGKMILFMLLLPALCYTAWTIVNEIAIKLAH